MTAYLAFKILALVKPAMFLSMNHNKAGKLTLLTVILLWIFEYLVKLINNKTICSEKLANFLNTMFEIKIDKSNFTFSLSLEMHIVTICLLQLIYSVIKRLHTNEIHRKSFKNNLGYDVERGNNRNTETNINNIFVNIGKENKSRFEKEAKIEDFLSGKGDYLIDICKGEAFQ